MSDSQVKKELKKYGLSAQGDRRTLVARHQRSVVLPLHSFIFMAIYGVNRG